MTVRNLRPVRFVVTFCDKHASKNVDSMLSSNFMGIGKTYRMDDPHVVVLQPFRDQYEGALETLEEMKEHGILTFVQQFR